MEPIEEIIPRISEAQDILGKFSKEIDEAVNFGSHVLKWDIETSKGGDENMPIVLLFRHFLELIDSVSILVKYSSIDPCKLILRGSLETYFGLEYLFEKDTIDRSMAFLVCHAHKKLKVYRKLDNDSNQSKAFLKEIQKDKSYDTLDLSRIPNIKDAIQNSESMLSLPIYQKAEAEYQRLIKLKFKNPPWYQLFNGPKNVKELSSHLQLNGLYEILYRYWSGSTHSTDIIDGKISHSNTGGVDIIQIRFIKDAQSITSYALTFSFKMFELFINKRTPSRLNEYKAWYQERKNTYLQIASTNRIITVN